MGVGVVRSWCWKGSKETITLTLPTSILTHPRSRSLTLTTLTLILTHPAVWDMFNGWTHQRYFERIPNGRVSEGEGEGGKGEWA